MARKKVTEPLAPILPGAAPAAPAPVAPAAASPYGPTIPPLADTPAPKAKAPRAPRAPKVPPVVAPPVAVAPPPAPPAIGGVPAIHDPIGDIRHGLRVGAVRLEDGAPPEPKVPGVREPASQVNARIAAEPAFQPPGPPPRSIPNTPPNAAGFREPVVSPPPPPGTGFRIVPPSDNLPVLAPRPQLPATIPGGPAIPLGPPASPPAPEPSFDGVRSEYRGGSRLDARLASEFPPVPAAPPSPAPPADFETAMGSIRAGSRGPIPPAPKAPPVVAGPAKSIPLRVGQAVRGYMPSTMMRNGIPRTPGVLKAGLPLAFQALADPDATAHAVAHPIETAGNIYGSLRDVGHAIPSLKENVGNIYGGLAHENPAVREATRIGGAHALAQGFGVNAMSRGLGAYGNGILATLGGTPHDARNPGADAGRSDGGSSEGDDALWHGGTTAQVFAESLRQAGNRDDPRFQHYAGPHAGPFPGDDPAAAKQAGSARYAAERNAVLAAKSAQTGQPFAPYGGSAATSEPYQPYGPGGPTIYAPAGEDPTLGFDQASGFRSIPATPGEAPARGGPQIPPPPPAPAAGPAGGDQMIPGSGGPVPGGIAGRSRERSASSQHEQQYDPYAGARGALLGIINGGQTSELLSSQSEAAARALGALPGYITNSAASSGHSATSTEGVPFHFPDPTAGAKAEHLLSEAALNRAKAGVFEDPTKFEGAVLMSGVDPAAAAAYGQRMRNMQPLPPGSENNPAHFDAVLAQRLPGALGAFGKMTPDMNVGTAAASLMDSGLFADGKINSPEEIAAARKLGQIFGVPAIQSELGTNPSTSWIPGMSDRDVPQRKRARSFLEQIMELLNGGPGEGASPGMPQTPAGFF